MFRLWILAIFILNLILESCQGNSQIFPSRNRAQYRAKLCCVLYTNDPLNPGNRNYFRLSDNLANYLRDSQQYHMMGLPSLMSNIINQNDSFQRMKHVLERAVNTDIVFLFRGVIGRETNTSSPNGISERLHLVENPSTNEGFVLDSDLENLILASSSRGCKFTLITLGCNASGMSDEMRTRANFPLANLTNFSNRKEIDMNKICLLHIFNTYANETIGSGTEEINLLKSMIRESRGINSKLVNKLSGNYNQSRNTESKIYFKLHTENAVF